ncbi:hypothetical protein [Mangrovicella endophytica]|uniref:hypothetical protein n=1 Tax=Mangrovicella endophytica TaxID=2066697 RepID=UPI000C9E37D0|nr:hypothetical protein [Mangrovicella endophytica]
MSDTPRKPGTPDPTPQPPASRDADGGYFGNVVERMDNDYAGVPNGERLIGADIGDDEDEDHEDDQDAG